MGFVRVPFPLDGAIGRGCFGGTTSTGMKAAVALRRVRSVVGLNEPRQRLRRGFSLALSIAFLQPMISTRKGNHDGMAGISTTSTMPT